MEHILQFAVSIDEDRIVKAAEQQASKQIVKNIEERVRAITLKQWGASQLDKMFKEEVQRVVEENKEYIITEAVDTLAKALARTKVAKEKLGEVVM